MRLTAVLALLAAAPALRAQAPKITPAGDPSVRADTIYHLAVDPAKHAEEDAVFLLDDGVVRREADGTGTRTFRQVIQVLKPAAATRLQEQSFSWSPSHQKLTVNWVRVVKPDGTIVSMAPAQVQESDVPAARNTPVYTDQRVRRMSLSGVEPGTLVDISWTVEETKPFMPRDFFEGWRVSTGGYVARSRFIVDLPATLTPRIREANLDFRRAEHVSSGRHTYMWARADVPKVTPEPFAADSNGVLMFVQLSSPVTWQDIAHWYGNLARSREVASPTIAAKVDSLVRGARTRDDSIGAVHKWVSQDIRYVAIALGIGGYQPRMPDTVRVTGFGDCKDKATLFVAAMRHLGIEAYPVLLSSVAAARRDLPSIQQFNHEIAAVATDSGWQYVDLTAGNVPWGELPLSEQGGFALLVRRDGTGEEVTLPRAPLTLNRSVTVVKGIVDSTGEFNGTYEEILDGAPAAVIRGVFFNPLDSAQRRNLANAIARRTFEGAEGDSLDAFDGRDLAARARVAVLVRHGRAATPAGATMILQMPIGSMASLANVAKDLESRAPRRFPIDVARVWGPRYTNTRYEITLPAGWHATLPKSVTATGPFGSYESTYSEANGVLRITRQITGATGVEPPGKVTDLIAWMRAVAADDVKFIVLTRAASSAGGR